MRLAFVDSRSIGSTEGSRLAGFVESMTCTARYEEEVEIVGLASTGQHEWVVEAGRW